MCRYGALPRISAEQIAHAFGVLPASPQAKPDLGVTQYCGAQPAVEAEYTSMAASTHAQQVPASHPREPVVIPPVEEATVVVTLLGSTDAKYRVPMSRIHHLPAVPQRVRVLCPMYDPEHPHESCVMGDACHHVHADVRGLVVVCAHVNYAWRNLEEVTYTRHEAGTAVHIAAPNSSVEVDLMDSGSLLVTKALESNRRPLTHCAHYYLNRRCNLGPDCRFVHAVFVNEQARPRQRAPAPVQLGREILPTRRTEVSALAAIKSAEAPTPAPANSAPLRVASTSLGPAAAAASHPMPVYAHSDHGSSLHAASQSDSHSGSTTPDLRGNSPRGRWRHDPYSHALYVFA